jgi:two-component system, chemotaxis family, protein-glutamate methylesterase/glutaminase
VTSAALAPPLRRTQAVARVMLCDDSVVIRGAIARMLDGDPQIQVVARVANGRQAIDEVARQSKAGTPVDVVVLDIEMPIMDGMTALPQILAAEPGIRVLMASTLTTRGADIALRALRLGAADYVAKPSTQQIADDSFRADLLAKIKGLARVRLRRGAPPPPGTPVVLRPPPTRAPQVLAVGSSTGGPQALFTLMQGLGRQVPVPVVLTQHMPPAFTPILADHLNRIEGIPCAEAKDGQILEAGRAYLAPGDRHLLVEGTHGALRARLSDGPPENFCRPSVDPMLRSAAQACGGRVLVVMLTGMGHDGLAGSRQVVAGGGGILAQDEASSVVWGMPGAVAQAGLCFQVLPIASIAAKVTETLRTVRA